MHARNNIQRQYSRGFSLVELLIVIVIVGVLSAVAIPIYNNNVENAKRSEVTVTMGYVKNALDVYYGTEGHFPVSEDWENVVGSDWNDFPTTTLRGTYFLSKYYDYQSTDGEKYRIRCFWNDGLDVDVDYWVDEQGIWSWEAGADE